MIRPGGITLSFNPFAYAQAEDTSNVSHANHSQPRHSFVSFNPYNHVQVEDLPITFNPVDHAEDVLSYFNSLNAVPMENPLAFNPYSHVEAVDSSICFNSATHPQMGVTLRSPTLRTWYNPDPLKSSIDRVSISLLSPCVLVNFSCA